LEVEGGGGGGGAALLVTLVVLVSDKSPAVAVSLDVRVTLVPTGTTPVSSSKSPMTCKRK
jgi:hypothetical protein